MSVRGRAHTLLPGEGIVAGRGQKGWGAASAHPSADETTPRRRLARGERRARDAAASAPIRVGDLEEARGGVDDEGGQAIRQSGNQAIRQSGNQAIRQSGNQAAQTWKVREVGSTTKVYMAIVMNWIATTSIAGSSRRLA
eukprot:6793897-Prymnesium_polylepis.1